MSDALCQGAVSGLLRGWFGVVEVVLWDVTVLGLGLAKHSQNCCGIVLCRATAAGLTGSHTDGDFEERKLCLNT